MCCKSPNDLNRTEHSEATKEICVKKEPNNFCYNIKKKFKKNYGKNIKNH